MWQARAVSIASVLISIYSFAYTSTQSTLLPIPQPVIDEFIKSTSVAGYFSGLGMKYEERTDPQATFPGSTLKLIGRSTVDLIAFDIRLLLDNHLNYLPRPVPQSYSVYTTVLDSLNAAHFYSNRRPAILLYQNISLDYRYGFWDESVTQAAVHLNYALVDSMTGKFDYLVLRSKAGTAIKPRFEKIKEQTAAMNELVPVAFPGSAPIYLKADLQYDLAGKVRRLLYQPPALSITLYFDDATKHDYRAIRPMCAGPILINKAVTSMADLRNFVTGDIARNRTITGFSFHSADQGFKQKIKLEFLRFSNY